MRIKSKKPRGIRVPSEMPEIEFNMKAIWEIKERKKKMYKRFLKGSKKGGV